MTLDELKKAYARMPGRRIYRNVKDKSITPSTDPALYTLKFGAHKGVALKDVPIDYLHWVITQVDSRPDVVELVKKFLGVPRDIFSVCAQTVANVYAEASKMDVTTLSKEDALRYQQTMDVTRRMQAVLDNDKEGFPSCPGGAPRPYGVVGKVNGQHSGDVCRSSLRAPVRSWSAPGAHGVGGLGRGSPFHLRYPKSPTILILWIIVTPIKLMPSVRRERKAGLSGR
jgi:hypothetical protein